MSSITSANSIVMLTVAGLFDAPQQLQGYTADDIFDIGDVVNAETVMGLDGILSAGWIPASKVQTISLQADSPSNLFFDTWIGAEKLAQDKYYAAGVVTLPGLSMVYQMVRGVLTSGSVMPAAKKTLQPRKFVITWQDVNPSPV